MYIRFAHLKNIKCFEQINIDFQSKHNTGDMLSNWNVILGNNGDGKTTLLQIIASGLMDLTTAERTLPLDGLIRGKKERCDYTVSIFLEHDHDKSQQSPGFYIKGQVYPGFYVNVTRRIYKAGSNMDWLDEAILATTKIFEPSPLYPEYTKSLPGKVKVSDEQRKFYDPDAMSYEGIEFLNRNAFARQNNIGWVSCGYGAVHSTNCYYTPTDIDDPLQRRFLTLFKESGTLYHGEDWLKELDRKALRHGAESLQARNLAEAKRALEALLPETTIQIDDEIRFIQRGHEVKLSQLSDGYRSMFALSVDLLRWLELMRPAPNIPINEVSGVVLIDEVDAHLHPTWQRQVGFWLTKTFPNIQFIVTTHSPFVAMAAGKGALTVLEKKGDAVEARQNVPFVRGWTVDKVLNELFELTSLRDPETEEKLTDYEELWLAQQTRVLNTEETTKLIELETYLNGRLAGDKESPKEQDLQADLAFFEANFPNQVK